MTDPSETLSLTTFQPSLEPTSSPASADGALPSNSPDGQTTCQCGPGPAPASRSRPRARKQASPTTGISGQHGSASSASAALQSSLESRLRQDLHSTGSTLFALTWREKATPSGRPILQRLASAPRTNDSDSTGWPTPVARDSKGANRSREGGACLVEASKLAPWGTPTANQFGGTPDQAVDRKRKAGMHESVTMLVHRVQMISGPTPNGSDAPTDGRAHLNPEHSRWLMGYPAGWASYADSETPSSRRLRHRSSKPQ